MVLIRTPTLPQSHCESSCVGTAAFVIRRHGYNLFVVIFGRDRWERHRALLTCTSKKPGCSSSAASTRFDKLERKHDNRQYEDMWIHNLHFLIKPPSAQRLAST